MKKFATVLAALALATAMTACDDGPPPEPSPAASLSTPSTPSVTVSSSAAPSTVLSGNAIAPSDMSYDWEGEPVDGPSIQLPDGDYRCYLSNAPADASYTYWGFVEVNGNDLTFNSSSGTITYTETSEVHLADLGFTTPPQAVVIDEGDGTIALWIRASGNVGRCAA